MQKTKKDGEQCHIGMIGLGRMGQNMAQRLLLRNVRVAVYDQNPEMVALVQKYGGCGAETVCDLVEQLGQPRAVWVMVPQGEPTETVIDTLIPLLSVGDTIIDGGNAHYKDSIRRAKKLSTHGIDFLDVGTSGGIWGLEKGYSLMVGGDHNVYERLLPVFDALAPQESGGLHHVGPAGSGHFVKMMHNGIEYGMMQAYAEGFDIMVAKQEFDLDLAQITQIWQKGSVVRSWLLDLTLRAFEEDPGLESLQAYVEDSGEGRWAIQESIDLSIPAPVITLALQARFYSRQQEPFGAKLLAALRQQFGGHAVKKTKVDDA